MGRPGARAALGFALDQRGHYVPRRMRLRALIFLFFAATMPACGNEIGDECETYQECFDAESDRLCLSPTEGFPGGYCTIFNCRPGECPAEAACVAYRYSLAPTPECSDNGYRSRLQRSYCMLRCNDDSDCRSGYECMEMSGDNPLGAVTLERESGVKVCSVPYLQPDDLPVRQSEVCESRLHPSERQSDGGSQRAEGGAEGGSSEAGSGSNGMTESGAGDSDDAAAQDSSADANEAGLMSVDGSQADPDASNYSDAPFEDGATSIDGASTLP